jgi:hypothetical protein
MPITNAISKKYNAHIERNFSEDFGEKISIIEDG